jgi:pilus assembly protein Flp/PilA
MRTLRRFLSDETGATAIEYGLIAALVSVAIIGVLSTIGTDLFDTFTSIEVRYLHQYRRVPRGSCQLRVTGILITHDTHQELS